MSLSQQVDVFYRPIILEKTERIQSYGWTDINLSYENAVNQNKKKMFAFVCGRECCGGAKEGLRKKIHWFCEPENSFWKLRKVEECFNAKWKIYTENAVDIIFFCNFGSTNGKDCDLDSISMNNMFLKHMGKWKNSKVQKNWSSRP